MNPIDQEVGETARSFMDIMRGQPLALALAIMNIALLALFYYQGVIAERERTTSEIGELLMNRLKALDTVAYIRFASVYRDFKDVREFKEELEQLLGAKENRKSNHR